MRSQTNEQALESSIEKTLTGTTQEELKEQGIIAETMEYGNNKMFYVGFNSDNNEISKNCFIDKDTNVNINLLETEEEDYEF